MAFNILYYNSSDGALTQADSTAVDQLAEFILEAMASGTYAGSISIDTSNPIGTFTDTVRQGGVGSGNITILSNVYTLSQINTVQKTTDPPQYLGLEIDGSNVVIQEDATSLDDLADEIISRMVSGGPNSYYLGTSAPSDGGTWVSLGSIKDTLENFTVTNTDYKLWHKKTSPTYTEVGKRPLKLTGSTELVEFSDTDISNLIKKVEERIIATGIGTYALQSSAPTTGTWANVGTITDVRRNTQNVNYAGAVNFSGNYVRAINFVGNYVRAINFVGNYVGPVNYVGNYVRAFGFGGNFVRSYPFQGTYVGDYVTWEDDPFDPENPTKKVTYIGNYVGNYVGLIYYTGNYVGDRTFAGNYVGDRAFTGNYVGNRAFTGNYVGNRAFTGNYVGDVNYTATEVSSSTSNISSVTLWKRIA